MKLSLTSCAAVALTIASVTIGGPAEAAPVSVRAFAAEQVRLAAIGDRIGGASADLCTSKRMMTGIVAHDLTQYGRSLRPAVSRAFFLRDGIGIVGIVPGSTADQAGLRVDDEILRIGSLSVEDPSAFTTDAKSSRRLAVFTAALDRALRSGPTTLLVRRNGHLHAISLRGRPGCGGDVALANSSNLNAWSDGNHVVVTTAMSGLARSEDEIAFVIAHEMAHNILGHSSGSGQRNGIFGKISQSRRGEIAADTYAVALMSRAGYQPEGGLSFLQTVSRRLWWAMSLDHPGFGRRMKAVASAIAALPRGTRYAQAAAPVPQALANPAPAAAKPVEMASYVPASYTGAPFSSGAYKSRLSCQR